MTRTILHVDLNNFYASVECLYHPELRGKPVAVSGDVENRHGIILAKNQLAKAAGVKTGTSVTAVGGGVDALTAQIATAIAAWSGQNTTIAADIAAGGTHLAQRTAATTAGLTDTDHDSGAHIDTITT